MSNGEISDRSVLTATTVHYLVEYFLATSSGDSTVSAGRTAREAAGDTPNREILAQAAAYYRARRYEKERGIPDYRGRNKPTA